jgi:hypothetical protein
LEAEAITEGSDPQDRLVRAIRETFDTDGDVLLGYALGGYVAAVIDPNLATTPPVGAQLAPLFQKLAALNEQIADVNQRLVLWEIEFFANQDSVFSVRALLRTNPRTYENGIPKTTAAVLDASVLAHMIDAEVLQLDPRARRDCRVRPDPKDSALIRIARYRELDLKGRAFEVTGVVAADGVWTVSLA